MLWFARIVVFRWHLVGIVYMITSKYKTCQSINNVALISSLELLLSLNLLSANLHKMINPNNIITNIPLRLTTEWYSS